MAVQSNDIFNNIKNATTQQMQNPADYLASLQDKFQQNAGQKMGINNQVDQMKNQLRSQGIDPDNQEGMQMTNMLGNQLYNQNQQGYLNNVFGISQAGQQAQGNLLQIANQSGNDVISGTQRDRAMQIDEGKENYAQQKNNIANNPFTKFGDAVLGASTQGFSQQLLGGSMQTETDKLMNNFMQQRISQMKGIGNLGGIN